MHKYAPSDTYKYGDNLPPTKIRPGGFDATPVAPEVAPPDPLCVSPDHPIWDGTRWVRAEDYARTGRLLPETPAAFGIRSRSWAPGPHPNDPEMRIATEIAGDRVAVERIVASGRIAIEASPDDDCPGCSTCRDPRDPLGEGWRLMQLGATIEQVLARIETPEDDTPVCSPTLYLTLTPAGGGPPAGVVAGSVTSAVHLTVADGEATLHLTHDDGTLRDALEALVALGPTTLVRLLHRRLNYAPDFIAIIPTAVSIAPNKYVELTLVNTSPSYHAEDAREFMAEIEALAEHYRRPDGSLIQLDPHSTMSAIFAVVEAPFVGAPSGTTVIEPPHGAAL